MRPDNSAALMHSTPHISPPRQGREGHRYAEISVESREDSGPEVRALNFPVRSSRGGLPGGPISPLRHGRPNFAPLRLDIALRQTEDPPPDRSLPVARWFYIVDTEPISGGAPRTSRRNGYAGHLGNRGSAPLSLPAQG